ncbi:hypothetical protein FG386_002458 [Cryptosporidium ryanae]|uniref:uncharacterized protein n=1 Tax=Cryptosporidium ryanae TaxID=515981 RepID=UPI00351A60DF|nr:hypothetical protein FG386_002458 [Cryptosporidium ryanae]
MNFGFSGGFFIAIIYFAYFFVLIYGAENLGGERDVENLVTSDSCEKNEHGEQELLLELESFPVVSAECKALPDLSSTDVEGTEQKSPEPKEEVGVDLGAEYKDGSDCGIHKEQGAECDDKDKVEGGIEYLEVTKERKYLYLEQAELLDIFVGFYRLRKDLNEINDKIEKDSYEIISSLDTTMQEDTSDVTEGVTNQEQNKKQCYTSRYSKLLKRLKAQNKQHRKQTKFVGTHEKDLLTSIEKNPPILGSQMPDEPPIVKRRMVPRIPLDTESARFKYEIMKKEHELEREKKKLSGILDSQLDSIVKIMEKQSQLLDLLNKLEEKIMHDDVIRDIRERLELQQLRTESLENELLKLLSKLWSQKIDIIMLKHEISSIQKRLLANGEILYKTCIQVNINDDIAKEIEEGEGKQKKYTSRLKMNIGGKRKTTRRFVSCIFTNVGPQSCGFASHLVIKQPKQKTVCEIGLREVTISEPHKKHTSGLKILQKGEERHKSTLKIIVTKKPRPGYTETIFHVDDKDTQPKREDIIDKKGDTEPDILKEIKSKLEKFKRARQLRRMSSANGPVKREDQDHDYESGPRKSVPFKGLPYNDWLNLINEARKKKEEEKLESKIKTEEMKKKAEEYMKSKFKDERNEREKIRKIRK